METLKTEVYKRGEANFDMTGRFLGYPLSKTDDSISQGLAKRLQRYATSRLGDCGFSFCAQWPCIVGTNEADERPSNRVYWVEFTNADGGQIQLTGILTRSGWPSLDHGFTVQENQ
jgi:hypothetical protein